MEHNSNTQTPRAQPRRLSLGSFLPRQHKERRTVSHFPVGSTRRNTTMLVCQTGTHQGLSKGADGQCNTDSLAVCFAMFFIQSFGHSGVFCFPNVCKQSASTPTTIESINKRHLRRVSVSGVIGTNCSKSKDHESTVHTTL